MTLADTSHVTAYEPLQRHGPPVLPIKGSVFSLSEIQDLVYAISTRKLSSRL